MLLRIPTGRMSGPGDHCHQREMTVRKAIHSVCCAALLASPAAMAGTSANIGVTSEYMFRGIPQTNGAAVQGGVDVTGDSGLYVGGWASNVNFAGGEGGNEFDLYGGWTHAFGALALDVGAIGYLYTEAEEAGGTNSSNFDYLEIYAGGTVGPIAAKLYYSPDYNNASQPSTYGTATATFPLGESGISLFAQGGSLTWDNIDSYIDYSAGITAANKTGLTITLGAYGTMGRGPGTAALLVSPASTDGATDADDVKAVISAKQVISF
jgi:uncharacterized protein (TIGR02001 family)